MNSRGIKSGVKDFDHKAKKTIRRPLPPQVANTLQQLYSLTGLSEGCPDLIIWNTSTMKIRFVEVKCPHWDRPTKGQEVFMRTAAGQRIATSIVEWEFEDHLDKKS